MKVNFVGGPHDGVTRDFTGWTGLPLVLYVPIPTNPEELHIDENIHWREPDAVYSLCCHTFAGETFYQYDRTVNYKP